jgi:hypothetical protein
MKSFNFKNINFLNLFSNIFFLAALVVMVAGAAHIGYSYAEFRCGIEHLGWSASNNIVFTMLLPYGVLVCLLVGAGIVLHLIDKKKK